MAFPLAAAAFSLQAAGTVAGFIGQSAQARAQNRQINEQNRLQTEYRYEVMRYQNQTWEQDLGYAREVLTYSQEEFAKQAQWAGVAMGAVEQNRSADAFTIMARGIEETIAATFQQTALRRQGQAARAQFQARERGVEGNSTEAVLGDIFRMEGEGIVSSELNRENTLRQLEREGIALDAQADQQMSQIASSIRTFAPNAPIRTPQPISPVNPTAPVTGPSVATLATGLGNAVMSGFNTYNSMTGNNMRQTMDQLSGWASRTFSLGGSSRSPNTFSSPVGGTP